VVAVLDAGVAATGLAGRTTSGVVVSVHRRAAYLRLDGELVALVGPGVAPGPLHVRCAALPELRAGEEVAVDRGRLAGRGWALRLPDEPWRGEWPDPAALAARSGPGGLTASGPTVPDAAVPDPTAPDPTVLDPAVVGPARRFAEGRAFVGLEELAAAVGGRGPGLTPSGDDLLAGVVLTARIAGGVGQPRLLGVVTEVPTTEVARAFLVWAARGQSIAPAHEWLVAVAAGDGAGAGRAREQLHRVGADSGRHLAAGLAAGVAQLPRAERRPGSAAGTREHPP
jgi:hypothetical protein